MVYVIDRKVMMTKDGESKHISILKDFNLYPDAFLGCSQDTNFMNFDLEEKIEKVTNTFNPIAISNKINEKTKGYMKYLESTK